MSVDLRQLEYFQMACCLGSITKAAEALHVSQPSVTSGIRRLEEELGVQLLERGWRNISPTADGRVFLQRVHDIMVRLNDAKTEMQDHCALQKGSLRIGIIPMMGAVLLPLAFARFQKEYPGVEITVTEEGSLSIATRLEKGELDLGVMITSNLPPTLDDVPILQGRIVVCLPPDHPLADLARIPFEALRDQPFILFREDTYSRQLIMEECARCHFTPRVILSSSQIGTVIGLVRQGAGIAFFIEEIAANQEGITVRPLANPLVLTAGLAWNRERYLSRSARAFIDSFQIRARPSSPGAGMIQPALSKAE